MIDKNILANKKIFGLLIISFVLIAASGLFFAITYFFLDNVNTAMAGANCTIENNIIVSSCSELWELSIYPFLAIKGVLVFTSFFFIFALVIGLLLFGYNSGTSPIMLGLLVVVEILITYGSIHIANIFRAIISNATIRGMLSEFTVYNKIMLNFPWFVFVVSLFSLALGIINYQKTNVNSSRSELDF